MSQCCQTTDGFVKVLFGPRVAVLCSQDAEIISRRNNLSFAELIKPFCSVNSELQVRDPGGQIYPIRDLHITVSDLRCKVPDENSVELMLSDVVMEASGAPDTYKTLNIDSERYQVNVNVSCPWFEAYRDVVTALAPQKLHEFINHCLSCLLVVSSSHPNPLEEFSKLSQHQNFMQHNNQQAPIRWMTPNTLKYYVLLHDNSNADIEKSKSVMHDLQGMYGSGACQLLRINSKLQDDDQRLPDPWGRFLNSKPQIATTEPNGITMNDSKIHGNLNVDPITVSTTIQPNDVTWVKELKAAAVIPQKGYGCCLTLSDHDSLRIFLQEFASKGLIPHMEKLIRNFYEQISSRKAIHRSLFRVTRTFFGGSKAASAPALKNYGAGGLESPELQVRKIADLCFLCQMYEHAYNYYHSIRKDFSNEQAWLHAAGASEMAAFSNFMQLRAQRPYPAHYVDSAIDVYLNNTPDQYLALRCTLVSLECLRTQGMYSEAAAQLKRLVNEQNDLLSAIMWEQIAQCYLRLKKPQLRKFAFYILLAGHRYYKATQHRCALMCYQNALQVYSETGWNVAIDFINFTIGRLFFQLQEYEKAASAFQLLLKESNQSSSQQAMYLNEYLHVAQFYCYNAETTAAHTIPRIMHADVVIRNAELATHCLKGETWSFLEESLSVIGFHNSSVIKNSVPFFKSNSGGFEAVVNEPLWIDVTMQNPLQVALAVQNAALIIDFVATYPDAKTTVECSPITEYIIPENTRSVLSFCIVPRSTGNFRLLGMSYSLQLAHITSFSSQMTAANVDLAGEQMFKSKELKVRVGPPMPKLEVVLDDATPKMLCGELKPIKITFANVGQCGLKNVKVAFDASNICLFTVPDQSLANVEEHFLKCAREISSEPYCTVQDLRQEELKQGDQFQLLLWLQAPAVEGRQSLNLVFDYGSAETMEGQTKSRSLKYTIDVYARQSLSVNVAVHKDNSQEGAVLIADVKNSGLSDSFTCAKLLCHSSSWLINEIASAAASSLEVAQATTLYFSIKDRNHTNDSSDFLQSVCLNGYGEKNSPESNVSALKLCHYNRNGKVAPPPQVDYLTVALQWTAELVKNAVVGHNYLHLVDVKNNTNSLETIGIYTDSDVVDDSSQSLVALHHLVKWRFQFSQTLCHDFQKSGLCFVPVKIFLQNQYNCKIRINVNGMDSNQTQNIGNPAANTRFFWTGKSLSKFVMQPKQSYAVEMKACFSSPGVYNINSFGVWAVPLRIEHRTPLLPQSCSYSCIITVQNTAKE